MAQTEHELLLFRGRARDWYQELYQEVIGNYLEIPCRQGMAYESPHSLVALVPSSEDVFSALASIDVPRRHVAKQRIQASILDALRRVLGYHETVLFDKYPILRRYMSPQTKPYYPRALMYTREDVPSEVQDEPWVGRTQIGSSTLYTIDQIQRSVSILSNPDTRQSKRALVDFGDGYKARCMMSWLFTVRDESLRIYVHMRSNDLLVGLPNNLIDARISQMIIAACIGTQIGSIHYQSDLVQIYNPDIAGQYGAVILAALFTLDNYETEIQTIGKLKEIPIIDDLSRILSPFFANPTQSHLEGLQRWRGIMANIEALFWNYNKECTPESRDCVSHLIGRYSKM